jgi:hypothetical protein
MTIDVGYVGKRAVGIFVFMPDWKMVAFVGVCRQQMSNSRRYNEGHSRFKVVTESVLGRLPRNTRMQAADKAIKWKSCLGYLLQCDGLAEDF